jgi:hypothetical protein
MLALALPLSGAFQPAGDSSANAASMPTICTSSNVSCVVHAPSSSPAPRPKPLVTIK